MKLDLKALIKALQQLEKSYGYAQSEMARKDAELFIQFRSAAIQAFEYSYELCIKMLKRQLEMMETSAETIDHLSYRDLIRTGAEKGLLEDVSAWFKFKDKRNLTVHTYDESKADDVYDILPQFIQSAQRLLTRLKAKN